MRLCCLWIRKDFGFEILILLIHKLIAIKEHYAILGNSNCSAKKISFLEVLMLIWIHFGNKCQLRKNRLAESALWMEPLGKQTSAVTQSRRTVAKRGLASQDRGDLPCPKLVVGLTHSGLPTLQSHSLYQWAACWITLASQCLSISAPWLLQFATWCSFCKKHFLPQLFLWNQRQKLQVSVHMASLFSSLTEQLKADNFRSHILI